MDKIKTYSEDFQVQIRFESMPIDEIINSFQKIKETNPDYFITVRLEQESDDYYCDDSCPVLNIYGSKLNPKEQAARSLNKYLGGTAKFVGIEKNNLIVYVKSKNAVKKVPNEWEKMKVKIVIIGETTPGNKKILTFSQNDAKISN